MSDENLTQQPKKRRGCLFYGCLTCVVLLVLALVLVFAAVQVIKKQIYAWTEAAPMQLPKVEMADAQFQSLQQRVTTFHDAMQQGKAGEPLVLTDNEINALIDKAENMKQLAGKVYVSLTNDQVKGQVSIPVPGVFWFARGRYLNGEAAFNVSLENGVLIVTAQEIRVKGKTVPESFMSALRKENLAKEFYKNPDQAATISKLESIHLEGDHVIIKAREVK